MALSFKSSRFFHGSGRSTLAVPSPAVMTFTSIAASQQGVAEPCCSSSMLLFFTSLCSALFSLFLSVCLFLELCVSTGVKFQIMCTRTCPIKLILILMLKNAVKADSFKQPSQSKQEVKETFSSCYRSDDDLIKSIQLVLSLQQLLFWLCSPVLFTE